MHNEWANKRWEHIINEHLRHRNTHIDANINFFLLTPLRLKLLGKRKGRFSWASLLSFGIFLLSVSYFENEQIFKKNNDPIISEWKKILDDNFLIRFLRKTVFHRPINSLNWLLFSKTWTKHWRIFWNRERDSPKLCISCKANNDKLIFL